uniref:40S ribosomal protein S3-3-like n=1 Tax=Rhizophora mucronata TaxID=61149 RepID=A0A2P2LRN5_RHIMU
MKKSIAGRHLCCQQLRLRSQWFKVLTANVLIVTNFICSHNCFMFFVTQLLGTNEFFPGTSLNCLTKFHPNFVLPFTVEIF